MPGWRDALLEAFALDPRIGAAFGPHLPRPATSPMIARELTEFFATFAAGDAPRVFGPGEPTFLSNVNAAYRRACWEEIRFAAVPYSEDQAFGRALAEHPAGQGVRAARRRAARARLPAAGVHAPLLRRVPRPARDDRARRADRRAIDGPRRPRARRERPAVDAGAGHAAARGHAAGPARSLLHHGGRRVFSALGSRARTRCPPPSSVRCRSRAAPTAADTPRPPAPPARLSGHDAPCPARGERLRGDHPGDARRARRRCAIRVPGHGGPSAAPRRVRDPAVLDRVRRPQHHLPAACCGSSGWATRAPIWLHDPRGQMHGGGGGAARHDPRAFRPVQAPVFRGFGDWYGADVAVATGWQTVFPLLEQPGVRARAYLDQRPRARVLRDLGGVDLGRRRPTGKGSTASRGARGCVICTSSATAARPARSSTAWTTTSTSPSR